MLSAKATQLFYFKHFIKLNVLCITAGENPLTVRPMQFCCPRRDRIAGTQCISMHCRSSLNNRRRWTLAGSEDQTIPSLCSFSNTNSSGDRAAFGPWRAMSTIGICPVPHTTSWSARLWSWPQKHFFLKKRYICSILDSVLALKF